MIKPDNAVSMVADFEERKRRGVRNFIPNQGTAVFHGTMDGSVTNTFRMYKARRRMSWSMKP